MGSARVPWKYLSTKYRYFLKRKVYIFLENEKKVDEGRFFVDWIVVRREYPYVAGFRGLADKTHKCFKWKMKL